MNDIAKSLGIRFLLVLGLLMVMAVASVDTPATVSAHGGDTSLVHLCVNDTNAETLIVHPLPPGDANIDCVNPPWPLGPGWSPVDVGTISGVTAGTGLTGGGTLGPVTLDADTTVLQQRVSGICAAGSSILVINQDGTVSCETDDVGIDGLGTLNFISKFTGAGTIGDSGIFEDALGNVGIGTATPNEQLEITGNFRLPSTTTTAGIIMSGGNRFIHNFGTENFFAGVNAGNLTMTGDGRNTGIGIDSLSSNTTGSFNMAAGRGALNSNTTGIDNTAAGAFALGSNTTGSANTATGRNALSANTAGFDNTANGGNALVANTTGSNNTATGQGALFSNTTGSFNMAAGRGALNSNTTGIDNTAAGAFALGSNTTGSANTATGRNALSANTTGFDNTANGGNALVANTT